MPPSLTITCFLVMISHDCKRFFLLYFKLVLLIEANVIYKTPIQSIFPFKCLYFGICFTLLWTVYCKSILRRSATSYTYKKIVKRKQTTAYIGNLCIFLSAQNYCPRKKMLNILVYKQSLQFYTGKKYIHNSWNICTRPE